MRSLRAPSILFTFTLGVLLVSCDNRSLTPPGPDGSSTGRAGSTSTGASGSGSGSAGTGAAGATGGNTGAAGATGGAGGHAGSGGAPGCDVPCTPIACKDGFTPTADPASCCPVCKPIVCSGACTIPPCGPNSHLEKAVGACCATCMPGTVDAACTQGQADYAAFRTQLLEKYSEGGCQTDDDCAVFSEESACATSCGNVVLAQALMNAIGNLDNEASIDCATCPALQVASCPPVTALCSNGMCVAGTPPTR